MNDVLVSHVLRHNFSNKDRPLKARILPTVRNVCYYVAYGDYLRFPVKRRNYLMVKIQFINH